MNSAVRIVALHNILSQNECANCVSVLIIGASCEIVVIVNITSHSYDWFVPLYTQVDVCVFMDSFIAIWITEPTV